MMSEPEVTLQERQNRFIHSLDGRNYEEGRMLGQLDEIKKIFVRTEGEPIGKVIDFLGGASPDLGLKVEEIVAKIARAYAEKEASAVCFHSVQERPYFTRIYHSDGMPLFAVLTWAVRIDQPAGTLHHFLMYLSSLGYKSAGREKEVLAAVEKFVRDVKEATGVEFTLDNS